MKPKTRELLERLADRDIEMTDADLYQLLQLSSLAKINIFMDHNMIIKRLCAALLEARGKDPWKSE